MSPFPLEAFVASLPWTALGVVLVLAVTYAVAVGQARHSVMDVAWGPGFVVDRGDRLCPLGRGRRRRPAGAPAGSDGHLGDPARHAHRPPGARRT
jgi:hypothetical protein